MPSPALKVFTSRGEYVASCKYAEDAAAVVSLNGDGSTIRYGHSSSWTLWTEGRESQPAAESYDTVAAVCRERLGELQRRSYEKQQRSEADARKRLGV